MALAPAYPEIEPYRQGRLRVSDLHELHFEECGNPGGQPVVVLHGGPGGGSMPYLRRLHDPAAYRIILFDQRGCGKSTPHAELRENTTWDLVADMERLREHLGIERWQVLGGSWGSTLALAYAETHPDRVTGLILRGIFTLRRSELLWFYQEGCNWLFPDAWEAYLAPIPPDERHDMMAAYHQAPHRRRSAPRPCAAPRPGASGRAPPFRCCPIRRASTSSAPMIMRSPSLRSNATTSSIAASSLMTAN